MVPAGRQRRTGRGAWLVGLFMAGLPLACGGMTAEDAGGADSDATGGSDGSVLDDGTAGGTGGASSSGGATGVGGVPATGGNSSTACSEHLDCVVTPAGCCGGCEPVLESHLVAMNWNAYQQRPQCDVLCGACAEADEVEWSGASFIARCVDANCEVVDVRDDYAECTTDEDCFLRNGSGCCEECDGSGFIALSSLDFVSEQACPELVCVTCDSQVPEGLSAQCNLETNRCEKVQD